MVRRRLSFWIFYFDNIAGSRLGGCPAILISVRLNVDQPRAFSVPIESERGSRFLFDAFLTRTGFHFAGKRSKAKPRVRARRHGVVQQR
jgi:hypothetical protein